MDTLNIQGIAARFVFAVLLVFLAYNPSGYSYFHWVKLSLPDNISPYLALSGVALVIGWAIYIRATLRSLGVIGISLAGVLLGCILWMFFDLGLLSLDNKSALSWVCLVMTSILLTIGISWSHIRRRLTGQVDTDVVDES